jgi:hypothetical protein
MRQWSAYFKRFSNVVVGIKETCGAATTIRSKGKVLYVNKQRGEKLLNAF